MYARRVEDKELTFDFAESLLQNNLLIVDRETNSVWSQLHGQAILGPMAGSPLRIVPSMQTTWKFWRELHPETRVMVVKGKKGRTYVYRDPDRGLRSRSRHDTSALGLGLVVGDQKMFFPFRELKRALMPLKLHLGGKEVTIHYRKAALTAWAEDREGNLLPAILAYKPGWMAFNPDSKVFSAKDSRR